ncbi:hypothetical protein HYV22_02920 [Candidatus Gottesmanbacteria bacterium]|nr:hypothetical protein [Candidatus Gottesmanbacteria bacterium]
MAVSPQEKDQGTATIRRVSRCIQDTALAVARREDLPPGAYVLVYDTETQRNFGAFVHIAYKSNGLAESSVFAVDVAPLLSLHDTADLLLGLFPGMPLICDREVLDNSGDAELFYIGEDHYRIEDGYFGDLEIYTPRKARS